MTKPDDGKLEVEDRKSRKPIDIRGNVGEGW